MNLNPMEQFTVKPIVPLHLFGYDVSFTNQSLLMVVVTAAAALFLTLAVKPGRLVPTRGQSMAELSYEFVANMIHSAAGEEGLKFFPFVLVILFLACRQLSLMSLITRLLEISTKGRRCAL